MRYAVIELGAETICQAVYEMQNNRLIQLYREEEPLGLLDYVRDNQLTEEGLARLDAVLEQMCGTGDLLKCEETVCVATASLRYLSNRAWVEDCLRRQRGISVRTLSGREEAGACAAGVLHQLGGEASGIGCDVGGGATQLFTFSQGCPGELLSLPVGGLRYFQMFVHGLIPTQEELEKMQRYTRQILKEYAALSKQKSRTLHLTGGSARLLNTLNTAYGGRERGRLSVKEAGSLLQMLRGGGIREVELLERILPGRTHTVLPVLVLLTTIGSFLGMEEFFLFACGAAEGVVLEQLRTRAA